MYQISREKMPELLAAVAKEMDLFLPVQNNGITNFGFWTEDAKVDLDTLKTVKSPKDAFFPQSEVLYSCYQKANKTSIEPAALKDAPFAIFGVRPCDVRAFDVLDRVFLSEPADVYYAARREHGIVFSLACHEPEDSCFCKTFGIDAAEPQADVAMWQVADGYAWEAKTEKGEKLTELVKDEPRIEVCPLQTKYPQGAERQLIYATTGRAINSAMLPADAGCVVDNVETMINIYQAVVEGKPSIERIVTVSGDAINEPGNFRAPFGMNQMELVEQAGGFKEEPEKVISGGPMMGFAMFGLDVPTTKTSSSLLCMSQDEVAAAEKLQTACINCGRCVEACPEQLIPSRLAKFSDKGLSEEFEKWHGLECVECGSCSFACPAKRQLAQSIKTMKKQVLAAKRKK